MSDGVKIVRALLAGATNVTALVPATRITAGPLPQDTALPAISVTSVSSVDLNTVAAGAKRRIKELVQVTVLAAKYPSQKQVQTAVRTACSHKFPDVSGASEIVVLSQGAGPDFMSDAADIYQGSNDFSVGFNVPTT